jgi:hypothetical protein
VIYPGKFYDFKAEISKDFEISKLKFEWTVTNGEILAGQGTLSIDVKPIDRCLDVTATFKISGLPGSCVSEVSVTGSISCDHRTTGIDYYGRIPFGKEKLRLKKFADELEYRSAATGFIIKYFPRSISKTKAYLNLQQILKYLELRGIDKSRIIFGATYDVEEKTSLWVVPAGAERPEFGDEILDAAQLAEKLKTVKAKPSKKPVKRKL